MKTSAITLGDWDVAAVTAFYLLHLVPGAGCCGPRSAGPVALALRRRWGQVAWHFGMIRDRTREGECFAPSGSTTGWATPFAGRGRPTTGSKPWPEPPRDLTQVPNSSPSSPRVAPPRAGLTKLALTPLSSSEHSAVGRTAL